MWEAAFALALWHSGDSQSTPPWPELRGFIALIWLNDTRPRT
jgi:hypothetical protein